MSQTPAILRAIVIAFSLALLAAAISACGAQGNKGPAPILLFTGTGTSPGDVAALETILNRQHLNYATVNSAELNAMVEEESGDTSC